MIWNAARGGMRSVVEAYIRDGFTDRENIRLIHAYGDGGFAARQLILLRALAVFAWCLARYRVELVHCHSAMRGSFWRKGLFASLARLFRVPVLLHLHGSEMKLFYRSQRPFVQNIIRNHLERATRVLVLSESWKEFIECVAPAARITVVPNYVKISEHMNSKDRLSQDIVFMGLVGPRKGTFDLIRAFHDIHDRHPDVRLIIGGNGQIAEAKALISELKLADRVSLAGWVDEKTKAQLLARSAIYALPSYNEGLPMSVLEAMAAGLAVVTTRVGGLPELVTDRVDGLLLDPGDRMGLARALSELLSDVDLRTRIAKAGVQRIKDHYSDRVVLPMLRSIYDACKRT
jgi:glycosyltransferase involved in cell wall biosynthesis